MILQERAYGKLNLTLEVLDRRPDGYHALRMILCEVDLYDDVTVELGAENGCVCVSPDGKADALPQDGENLAFRAAKAYFAASKIDLKGCFVRIEKRIPTQAGMAGGSSDAAAVLRALNRHYGAFSSEELRALGLKLGSDVPYCLFGGVALAEGRGERLTRLAALPETLHFVLVKPEFSVSTPRLFGALDKARADGTCRAAAREGQTAAMLTAISEGNAAAIGAALFNDFAPVLAREFPTVEQCKRTLIAHGALGAELTGTGSVIYGVFADRQRAEAACALLAPHRTLVVRCAPR